MCYNRELTDGEKEYIERFHEVFDHVLIYNGDDELISSVNSEYNLDQDDVFRTDGDVNFAFHIVNGCDSATQSPIYQPSNQYVQYSLCIRNATYLIIADRSVDGKQWEYDLRVDLPFVEVNGQTIIDTVNAMKGTIEDMEYYINHWRCSGGLIKDGTTMTELYAI